MAHRTVFSSLADAALLLLLLQLAGAASVTATGVGAQDLRSANDGVASCSSAEDEDYTSFLARHHAVETQRKHMSARADSALDAASMLSREELITQLKRCLQSEKAGFDGAVPSEVAYSSRDLPPAESERWGLHNLRIANKMKPLAVVFAESYREVAQAVSCAESLDIPVSGQSGRHSYIPYCETSCLLVNVHKLQAVDINAAAGTAVMGSGLNLGQAYAVLADHGFTIPSGTCPSVGLGGSTLGGGQGILNRMHGLAIDQLAGVDAVLLNGTYMHANASHNADLFWLARGGGGEVFPGVATAYHFNLVKLPPVLTEYLAKWQMPCTGTECKRVSLDATMSTLIVQVWQQYYLTHPDRRVHVVLDFHPLSEAPGEGPYILLAFKFIGMEQSEAEPLLQPALDALKEYTHTGTWSSNPYVKKIAIDAGIGAMPPGEGCKTWEEGLTDEDIRQEMLKSEPPFCLPSAGFDLGQKYRALVASTLSDQSIEKLLEWIVRAPRFTLPDGEFWIFDIQLEPTNGYTADVDQSATAFPWRTKDAMTLQVVSMWAAPFANSSTRPILEALSYGIITNLQPYIGTRSYYNYADDYMAGGADPLDAYFGPNKARVLRIASEYGDPVSG